MEAIGPRAGSAAWRWVAAVGVALAALLALDRWQSAPVAPEAPERPGVALTGVAGSYSETLARLDFVIANAKAQAEAAGDQWLLHETVARNYVERARLSGDYGDYAAAEAALKRAFAVAAPGTGPHLVSAQLEFGMHRLAGAERQLALIDGYAIPGGPEERAETMAMRGDIAFYRGDLPNALRLYDEADRLAPGTATFRRAIYAARTGDMDGAERYFDQTEREARLPPPQLRAYLELQRGILDLDRDRLDEAMAHFRRADRIFPGYWLIEEHIAEVLTLQGRLPEAERRYRDIVRRTGHPEFMDALAGVLARQGRTDEARRVTDQAWTAWRKRLAQFPEAAYGHAVDHCIGKQDWPCAVRLATLNHAARPHGDAKIMLAKALIGAGRTKEADALVQAVLATPWRTPELTSIAAQLRAARAE
jgi:tetratricopeptide (TPR) repeat protein